MNVHARPIFGTRRRRWLAASTALALLASIGIAVAWTRGGLQVFGLGREARPSQSGSQSASQSPSAEPSASTTPDASASAMLGAALGLKPIPWEGGPAYYARFPQAKAHGWTDPSFFPVAVWGATVADQRDINVDKEIGLNTYLELYGKVNFKVIRDNRMSAIHGIKDPGVGNETVAWFLADEPEQFGQGPGEVLNYLKNQASKFPNDGRMRFTNFTGNTILPNYSPGDKIVAGWLDLNHMFSLDIYWYGRDLVCGGSVAGEVWTNGSGKKQPHGNGHNDLSQAECHRSQNYGWQVDAMRRVGALSGTMKPVWTFVENGSPFSPPDVVHTITPDQMAGAVWNSLIHGARGVVYFNNTFTGNCVSSNNFRYPVYYNQSCYTAIRAKAKEVNLRIKQLAPVLNTQSYAHTFDPKLDTMLKAYDGSYYIFAMPAAVKGGSATGRHTLQLPTGMQASKAEVLFEGRNITIDAEGRFTDDFAAEHTYHIYKLS